ncbi:hypothetical protein BGAPBR_E0045 (plasmid) [Borreliella garinii PBr]|uniref:Uncharacterized protein n=1 Tax=Borreliella garinii PBr TaxID=498743 RepID=B8F0M4_BORGR|nr:hypothetical protein BGAPBR_E0045 [Borreliella garinii PBr]
MFTIQKSYKEIFLVLVHRYILDMYSSGYLNNSLFELSFLFKSESEDMTAP